jgi:hypothetical protein
MANLTCNDFAKIPDSILSACITLVRNVSYCAQTHDYPQSDQANWLTKIHHREADNGWQTWYHPDAATPGGVDACAFFQRMRELGGYAMCIGFSTSWATQILAGNPQAFIDAMMGDGTDGLFCYFVKNCLGPTWAPGQQYVNLVWGFPWVDANYDKARDTLFQYMQGKSGAHWSLPSASNKTFQSRFWGDNNSTLSLWPLKIF